MEKLTGPKHNHLLTDLVKVCIFTLMLLLPFLCFIPTSLYYAFNEHALVNTEEKPVYEYEQVNFNQLANVVSYDYNVQDNLIIEINNNYAEATLETYAGTESAIYNFVPVIESINQQHKYLVELRDLQYVNNGFSIRLGGPSYTLLYDYTTETYTPRIVENATEIYLGFDARYSAENDFPKEISFYIQVFDLTQMFGSGNEPTINQFNQWFDEDYYNYTLSKMEIIEIDTGETRNYADITSNITNAWEDLWKSPIFNWTNYTPLNTGLNAFISIFGINQSSYVANCLVYLLSITAIYVVFDIVLGIFKWLTHLINK